MALEKATIEKFADQDPDARSKSESIQVLFNPTEYQLAQSNQFAEVAVPGLSAPLLQFGRGNARTLTMQLFFDTYEEGIDVRDYTNRVLKLLAIDSHLHAPPICRFVWGDLVFICVLEQANQRFTLFLDNGTPVRATMDVTLKEFLDRTKQAANQQSADFDKTHIVQKDEAMFHLANRYFGDPAQWRLIAEHNGIDNPLVLTPGKALKIPAITERTMERGRGTH
jgi:hypothetical protein